MNKAQRATLKAMFGGRCAYCGCELGDRWHADHVEPVIRKLAIVGNRMVTTGEMHKPERNRHDNLFPSCVPCNIDKSSNNLDHWRRKLEESCDVLGRNNATYRHGVRFGLIQEARQPIVFYFERLAAAQSGASA